MLRRSLALVAVAAVLLLAAPSASASSLHLPDNVAARLHALAEELDDTALLELHTALTDPSAFSKMSTLMDSIRVNLKTGHANSRSVYSHEEAVCDATLAELKKLLQPGKERFENATATRETLGPKIIKAESRVKNITKEIEPEETRITGVNRKLNESKDAREGEFKRYKVKVADAQAVLKAVDLVVARLKRGLGGDMDSAKYEPENKENDSTAATSNASGSSNTTRFVELRRAAAQIQDRALASMVESIMTALQGSDDPTNVKNVLELLKLLHFQVQQYLVGLKKDEDVSVATWNATRLELLHERALVTSSVQPQLTERSNLRAFLRNARHKVALALNALEEHDKDVQWHSWQAEKERTKRRCKHIRESFRRERKARVDMNKTLKAILKVLKVHKGTTADKSLGAMDVPVLDPVQQLHAAPKNSST